MRCTEKEQETCEFEKRGCTGCAYNEKSADEMFADLGYKLKIANIGKEVPKDFVLFRYENDNNVQVNFYNDDEKSFSVVRLREYYYIDIKLLQAIYQKCKEMRWIQ